MPSTTDSLRNTIRNTFRNALRPGYLSTLGGKVVTRAVELRRGGDRSAHRHWAEEHAEPTAAFARKLDRDLWDESLRFGETLADLAGERLGDLRARGVSLGGGGDYCLLYFLVRHLEPATTVETGVAAGFTSQAILSALARNGSGELWSSDFPYFRLENPESHVGVLVDDELRSGWHLLLKGDRANLPAILRAVSKVDLFHYDSDKSYRGRRFAISTIEGHLSRSAHVVMDDIEDNAFFSEWVERTGAPYRVFEFGGKYLGLVGELAST